MNSILAAVAGPASESLRMGMTAGLGDDVDVIAGVDHGDAALV